MELKPLKDQVVVITGASSGIGLVTARTAAAQGAAATDLTALRQESAPVTQAATAYASTAAAFGGTSDLRSLFQTDQRGAASDAAARLWQARNAAPPAQHARRHRVHREERILVLDERAE